MANNELYLVTKDDLTAIADAIREISGNTDSIVFDEFSSLIKNNKTGNTYNITVNVDSGSTVTATNGETSVSGVSNGSCDLIINKTGTWTVYATNSENKTSNRRIIEISNSYNADLIFFEAYIKVITKAGATLTCSNGIETYTEIASSDFVTFRVNEPGEWIISGENEDEYDSKTISVTNEEIYLTDLLSGVSKILDENDWETIRRVSDSGNASYFWSVGDKKGITLDGTVGSLTFSNETYYAYIIGIDHNSEYEGTNRIHFQFGYTSLDDDKNITFVDTEYGDIVSSGSWFNMNNSGNNNGGWSECTMRTSICTSFKAALPSDLQSVLKTVTKYSDNVGGSNLESNVTATTDTIFLLSDFELFGTKSSFTNEAESIYQKQYEYYSLGNSKVKYKHNSLSTSTNYWLRSASATNSTGFLRTNASYVYSTNASIVYGFTPCFCV